MSKHNQFDNNHSPLTPAIFYILLSLATKQRHGYDIMKQVKIDSNGKINLGPGTLYGAIKRLLEEKLIIQVKTPSARRKYYLLTDKGRSMFNYELKRYQQAVEVAQQRNLIGSLLIKDFNV